jgi:hypothetical protein
MESVSRRTMDHEHRSILWNDWRYQMSRCYVSVTIERQNHLDNYPHGAGALANMCLISSLSQSKVIYSKLRYRSEATNAAV